MKQKYTKDEYRKKLILLIGKIDKIRNKYKDNNLMLIIIDYISKKAEKELLEVNI
ncbi:MAG: hypothetical protein Q9M97_00260 [Candidatus Gracilibacteria bacterium]|nr:hypothetical protein [Candidatus Gracilibacteria bacterium]